jgi:acylphosphatase
VLHIAPAICDTAFAVIVRRYVVKGRVQGVGFRWFVLREAGALQLRGRVRNTVDGEVEVLAAGNEADLRSLYASLQRGSRGSRVDRIVVNELPESEAVGLEAFEIEGAW